MVRTVSVRGWSGVAIFMMSRRSTSAPGIVVRPGNSYKASAIAAHAKEVQELDTKEEQILRPILGTLDKDIHDCETLGEVAGLEFEIPDWSDVEFKRKTEIIVENLDDILRERKRLFFTVPEACRGVWSAVLRFALVAFSKYPGVNSSAMLLVSSALVLGAMRGGKRTHLRTSKLVAARAALFVRLEFRTLIENFFRHSALRLESKSKESTFDFDMAAFNRLMKDGKLHQAVLLIKGANAKKVSSYSLQDEEDIRSKLKAPAPGQEGKALPAKELLDQLIDEHKPEPLKITGKLLRDWLKGKGGSSFIPKNRTGGMSGMSTNHILDAIRAPGGQVKVTDALASFCNAAMSGQIPQEHVVYFKSGVGLYLEEKEGKKRAVVSMEVLLRLVSKVITKVVTPDVVQRWGYLNYGVGVNRGISKLKARLEEALAADDGVDKALVSMDVSVMFHNTSRKEAMILCARYPDLRPLLHIFHWFLEVTYAYFGNFVVKGEGIKVAIDQGFEMGLSLAGLLSCEVLVTNVLRPLKSAFPSTSIGGYIDNVEAVVPAKLVKFYITHLRNLGKPNGFLFLDRPGQQIMVKLDPKSEKLFQEWKQTYPNWTLVRIGGPNSQRVLEGINASMSSDSFGVMLEGTPYGDPLYKEAAALKVVKKAEGIVACMEKYPDMHVLLKFKILKKVILPMASFSMQNSLWSNATTQALEDVKWRALEDIFGRKLSSAHRRFVEIAFKVYHMGVIALASRLATMLYIVQDPLLPPLRRTNPTQMLLQLFNKHVREEDKVECNDQEVAMLTQKSQKDLTLILVRKRRDELIQDVNISDKTRMWLAAAETKGGLSWTRGNYQDIIDQDSWRDTPWLSSAGAKRLLQRMLGTGNLDRESPFLPEGCKWLNVRCGRVAASSGGQCSKNIGADGYHSTDACRMIYYPRHQKFLAHLLQLVTQLDAIGSASGKLPGTHDRSDGKVFVGGKEYEIDVSVSSPFKKSELTSSRVLKRTMVNGVEKWTHNGEMSVLKHLQSVENTKFQQYDAVCTTAGRVFVPIVASTSTAFLGEGAWKLVNALAEQAMAVRSLSRSVAVAKIREFLSTAVMVAIDDDLQWAIMTINKVRKDKKVPGMCAL